MTLSIQLPYDSAKSTLRHLLQGNDNLGSHKNGYVNVHRSFIGNQPTGLEISQMFFKGELLSCDTYVPWNPTQQQKAMIHETTWLNLQVVSLSEKSVPQSHILSDSIYITFLT